MLKSTANAPVNGVSLHYESCGEGEALVCLHGGMGLGSEYLQTPAIIDLASHGHKVLIYDQRGHGKSQRCEPGEYTHENWVNDLLGLVDLLGYERFSLLGHSYGGFIGLEFATRYPERLNKMILVGTSPGPVQVGPMPEISSDDDLRMIFRVQWPAYFSGREKHWDVFDRMSFSLQPFLEAFNRELPVYDVRSQMASIDIPVLLLVGSRDRYLDDMMHLNGLLPDSRIYILQDCGHMPFYEEPGKFQTIALDFLS